MYSTVLIMYVLQQLMKGNVCTEQKEEFHGRRHTKELRCKDASVTTVGQQQSREGGEEDVCCRGMTIVDVSCKQTQRTGNMITWLENGGVDCQNLVANFSMGSNGNFL